MKLNLMSRRFFHLISSDFRSPFDEMDPRLYSLRTGRFLQGMNLLADSKPQFMERNILTKEYKPVRQGSSLLTSTFRSAFPAPSRRNVALQSIFNQMASPDPFPLSSPPEATEPDLSVQESDTDEKPVVKSTIGDGRRSRLSPPSYYFEGHSNPPTPNPELFSIPLEGKGDTQSFLRGSTPELNNDFNSLFTSIWTPFQEKTPEGGWK